MNLVNFTCTSLQLGIIVYIFSVGNCAYGRILMDKSIHTITSFTSEFNLPKHKKPTLQGYGRIERYYRKVNERVSMIYPYKLELLSSKLNLINCGEFINKYLINDLYQLMECDTDSLYIAFARDSKEEWNIEKLIFFHPKILHCESLQVN